ncbi:LacI family DNA-binding transcriptional regulator [Geofilum rubicundum]|uniref:LacI family transcriptional regulator n=1 Tax=Geofilum rubicundum JCM 15548 TaxID=1236989 RepID=A0A0E9LZ84_9BACT|nr:LacI family DNA-binding transcriptional regulator [Geofilum rubicundum]GAO30190.1 LacI family transcriptional regulator [Geofilum rubicundum JCM 15548]
MKRTTIIDIARSLGITPSTVSRALAGNLRVSESTRKRVQEKALEMGYQPNIVASSLRRGKSDTIGMLVPRINRHFFSHVISAVEEILNPAGYNLLICQSHEKSELENQALQVLLKNRVAGIIMSHAMETVDFEMARKATEERVPVVQFDRVNKEVPGPRIVNDNFSGAYMAVKHLIRGGYSRIAHLTGSLGVNVYSERHRGYRYAMEEASLDFDELVFEGAITRETGYEKALQLVKQHRVDAFFCAGDFASVGTIQAIHDCGLRVPEDMGVVGFANEPFAGFITPQLTTVEQNAYDMGHRAANALIRVIGGQIMTGMDQEEVVPVRLLVRESSMRATVNNK